jgi:hypothetical protein
VRPLLFFLKKKGIEAHDREKMVQNLWSLSSNRTTTIAMLFLFLMDRVLRNKSVDFDHAILSKHCVRVFSCIVESLDHAEDKGFSLLTMLP